MARGGKREGAGRKLNYDAYVREYKAKQRKLAANGVAMNETMLSKTDFKTQYTRLKNERKIEVALGQRKTLGNITRDLVDKQAFALSTKQAQAMLKDKTTGQNWYQLRSGSFIELDYYKYKKEWETLHPDRMNEASAYAKNLISTEYFGS